MITREYLSFWESISQIYFNHYTIVLVILIIKIYLFKRSVIDSLNNLQVAEVSCEQDATLINAKVFDMFQFIIIQSLNSIQVINLKFFQMIITIIENIIWFVIELFLGTYTCLLQALITNTADFAVDASESIIVAVNSTIVGLTNDIEDGLNGLSKIINDFISIGSKISNFFTGSSSSDNNGQQYQNSINLSISGLKNISIPSSVLTSINNFKLTTLPNFTNIENDYKDLISLPLDTFLNQSTISNPINETELTLNFPQFPIQTLCSNASNKYNEDLMYLVDKVEFISKIIFIALSICCILSIIPLIYQHYYHYYVKLPQLLNALDDDNDEIIKINNTLHSFYNSSWITNLFYKVFNIKSHKLKWLITYLSTNYCLIILGLGLIGILSCVLQLIIIIILNKQIHITTTYLQQSIIPSNQTNSTITSAITQYITDVNQFIQQEENQINQQLFGTLLQTTSSINSTIATFVNNLNSTISSTFGDIPVLSTSISTIVYCTLIRRLITVEKGLTWINNSFKISIPLLNSTSFETQLLNVLDDSEAMNASNSQLLELINKTIDSYKQSVKIEFLISLIFIAVWLIQLLIGLIIIMIQTWLNQPKTDFTVSSLFSPSLPSNPPPHYDTTHISSPQPLTIAQKHEYGYPFTNPYDEKVYSTSSRYPSTLESM
ncbi:hypothetical protein DFJ63DRAFT_313728 [Scheffersomyces coipomensis]|uniref:uncharacterized protein n=1 Tax=Scheffersomyces coipomensis TaxID=1788519 RepID=UPI00315D9B13